MATTSGAPIPRIPRAEVKQRLLDAAAELFSRRGVHATTLDDVARAAGFSKGAVYSNFSSKDDLVRSLMRRETDGALGALEGMFFPGTSLDQLPEKIGTAFAPYGPGQVEDFALMSEFRAHALSHPEVMADFVRQRREVLDALHGLVEEVFQGQTVPVTGLESRTLARVLICLTLGVAFDWPATGEQAAGDVMGDVVAALTRGVTP